MNVRVAEPSDWPRVRELRLRGLREDPRAFGARLDEEEAQPETFWRERLENAKARTLVVGEWQGLCTVLAPDEESTSELVGMWVGPQARGSGAGRALLDAALAQAREWGATRVRLWVNVEMAAAVRLYERAGFARAGPPTPGTRDPTRTYQRMERAP